MKRKSKKSFDVELNLVPFIDLLSVCICFLLLTAVWMQFGTFNTSQAMGTQGADTKKNPPALWVEFENNGSITMMLKKDNKTTQKSIIPAVGKHANFARIDAVAMKMKSATPDLNIALILPAAHSPYEDVVTVMDRLKKQKFLDIGISPL